MDEPYGKTSTKKKEEIENEYRRLKKKRDGHANILNGFFHMEYVWKYHVINNLIVNYSEASGNITMDI